MFIHDSIHNSEETDLQLERPPVAKQIMKMWYIYNVELIQPSRKKNGIFRKKLMDLNIAMLIKD